MLSIKNKYRHPLFSSKDFKKLQELLSSKKKLEVNNQYTKDDNLDIELAAIFDKNGIKTHID